MREAGGSFLGYITGSQNTMVILAFDTTSRHGSAALFRGAEQLAEVRDDGQANYSVKLFEMVKRLLAEGGLGLPDVELFAAATGPGSFTGIRVGLAAAQGWATALSRPVRGISVLEAMVEAGKSGASIAVPLLDARRSEFYLGVFERDASSTESRYGLRGDGLVLNAEGIADLARKLVSEGHHGVDFIVKEDDRAALELRPRLSGTMRWNTVQSYLAPALGRLAWAAATAGQLQRAEELDAWYIRRSDAELNWSSEG